MKGVNLKKRGLYLPQVNYHYFFYTWNAKKNVPLVTNYQTPGVGGMGGGGAGTNDGKY